MYQKEYILDCRKNRNHQFANRLSCMIGESLAGCRFYRHPGMYKDSTSMKLYIVYTNDIRYNMKMKEKIINLFNKYKQFIIFCIVGASNTLITFVVLAILVKYNVHNLIATTIGYTCGILNGYLWSSKIVFRKKKTIDNAVKFTIVNLITIGVNLALMWILTEKKYIYVMWAQGITICFTMPLNFILNKIWTYRSKSS